MGKKAAAKGGPAAQDTAPKRLGRLVRRFGFHGGVVICLVLHVALTLHFEPVEVIWSEEPNSWLDFDTHIGQAFKISEALDRWGKSWAYDPQLLGGVPVGTVFDADNKGWELWTYALWKLGVSKGLAFNLFVWLAYFLVPIVVALAARLFGMGRWTGLVAVALGICLWHFDAYPRWCNWVGMVAWAMASYFGLLPLALLYRLLKGGSLWLAGWLGVTLAVGHLIHPYIFGILVLPMLLLYVREFRTLDRKRHGVIIAAAAVTILVNLYWIVVALAFSPDILVERAEYGKSTLSFLITDWLGLINEPMATGFVGNRTAFRSLVLVAGIVGLLCWRKNRDDRFAPFAVGAIAMLSLAYVAGYVESIAHIVQPYRHVLPAMYLALLPAAAALVEGGRSLGSSAVPRTVSILLIVGLCLALPVLARDVLYYFPGAHPDVRPIPAEAETSMMRLVDPRTGALYKHHKFSHRETFQDFDDVVTWLAKNDEGQGRVLVQSWMLGEHLAWRSDSQILGGFFERPYQHALANLFRRNIDGALSERALERYLIDYAVRLIIVTHPKPALERGFPRLIEPIGFIPVRSRPDFPHHRVYRTRIPVSLFARNSGSIRTSLNRIEVSGTDPARDVVLRYHWLETMVCEPGCRVQREPVEGDPVGFIRVSAPHPADFVVKNKY